MRFALISFLNARPLWWGLLHGPGPASHNFEFTLPARCADLIAEGTVQLGLVPAIEILRIPGVAAFPSICIASRAEVRSVLLVSKVPFEQIRSVALDPSSRTSVSLARILLAERLGEEVYRSIRFDPLERARIASFEGHDAAVVIGDPALQLSKSAAPFRYDLASEWVREFGEPFVFALWAGRREALRDRDLESVLRELEASRAWGLEHVDTIAREAAEELGLPFEEIHEYFRDSLHYDLGEPERRALARFSTLARRWGLVEGTKDIEWLINPESKRS